MKKVAYTFSLLLATLLIGTANAQTVVEGNVWILVRVDPIIQSNHYGTILQRADDDRTSVLFDYDGAGITLRASNIDEGSAWFAAQAGDVLGFESLRERRLSEIGYDAPTYAGEDEFYLGVATTGQGYRSDPCRTGEFYADSLECRNVFGWMHVRNEGGELVVLDSAVAYDSFGIVVGSLQTVPEPSSISMLVMGGLMMSSLAGRRAI